MIFHETKPLICTLDPDIMRSYCSIISIRLITFTKSVLSALAMHYIIKLKNLLCTKISRAIYCKSSNGVDWPNILKWKPVYFQIVPVEGLVVLPMEMHALCLHVQPPMASYWPTNLIKITHASKYYLSQVASVLMHAKFCGPYPHWLHKTKMVALVRGLL